jgi:membrane-associated protein
MSRTKFIVYDVVGALLWVGGLTTAGYLFGNIPWIKANLDKIIWSAIFIPGVLVLVGSWRAGRKRFG